MFERNKIQKIYQIGYEHAQRKLENLSHLLKIQKEPIYRTLNNKGGDLGIGSYVFQLNKKPVQMEFWTDQE